MRYSSRNFWLLTGLGLALVVGAHLLPHAARGSALWSASAIGFGAMMLLGCAFAGLSYGAMDDIQKQNMKSDWYWGSMIGIGLLCGLVFPFVLFGDGVGLISGLFHRTKTPNGYFFCGVMVTLGLFVLGFLVAYLFRRLRWLSK